jgi:hypothetical protein
MAIKITFLQIMPFKIKAIVDKLKAKEVATNAPRCTHALLLVMALTANHAGSQRCCCWGMQQQPSERGCKLMASSGVSGCC